MADRSAIARLGAWGRAAGGLARACRTRPWRVVWGALAACLAGWMLWECLLPLEGNARNEAVAQAGRGLSPPQSSPIVPESLNLLYQRVLFKARNQTAPSASVQATARELVKKLQLRSISQQGQAWVAYIQVKSEGVKRVAVGDKVAEFGVVQIDRSSVRLQLGSEQVVLGF